MKPRLNFKGHWLAGYMGALLAVGAGLLVRVALTAWAGPDMPPYITFYPAVMVAALLAGFGPGLAATVAAALTVAYWVLPPQGLGIERVSDALALVFFLGMGLFMSVVAEVYRRSRQKVAEAVAAEQQRLNDVLNMLPAYVVLLSPDYHVPFANRFFEQRFGKSHGKRCFEYLFNRTEPCENCETYKVLKTNEPQRWEWTGPDGRNYDIFDFPFTDSDGSPLIMEVGIDITERKRAEAALQEANERLEQRVAERTAALGESEERLRLALAATDLGTWDYNPITGALKWDARCKEVFGLPPEVEVSYDTFLAGLHPEDRDGTHQVVQRTFDPAGGGLYDTEYRTVGLREGGVVRWIRATGRAFFNEAGQAVRFIGTAQDITERKRAEARLTADLAALTRMHALSGRLLGAGGLQPLLQEIVDAAVGIVGAERGTLQLLEGDSLRILAHHGHRRPFLEFFASAETRASVCGEATKRGERVVVPDVETSSLFAGTPSLGVLREAGVRAVQSTPMVSRTGALLGVLTTQWGSAYSPDEHDLWRIDLLARQAGDLIEYAKAEKALRESETRYRTLFETMTEGFALAQIICDEAGKPCDLRYLAVNPAFERQTGRKAAEVIGRTIREAFPGAEPEWFERYGKVALTGEPAHFEGWFRPLGRCFQVSAFQTEPGRFGVVFMDVTERKGRELLDRAQSHIGNLIHSTLSLDDIMQCALREAAVALKSETAAISLRQGSEWVVAYAHGFSREMVGMRMSDQEEPHALLASRTGKPVAIPDAFNDPRVNREHIIKWNVRSVMVIPLRSKDEISGVLFLNYHQSPHAFTPAEEDFGVQLATSLSLALENARLYDALRQHAENLEKTVQERTAKLRELVGELEHFSYTITHDMRAPLRAMQGFGQVMLEGGCAECANGPNNSFLKKIITSAERMDQLITDALNYAKVVRAEVPLAPVDLGGLLRGILDTYPNLQPPNAEVRLDGEIPRVMGNEAALTQCFGNLLGNAVKFVAPGVLPKVRVWSETKEDCVLVWVEDNGIGIPAHCKLRIFDMFQRVSKEYEGTGIGLTLVRKNMERMGGKVGVESELGRGSRFWLRFQRPS